MRETLASLRKVTAHVPKAPDRSGQLKPRARIALFGPFQRRPPISVLDFQAPQPSALIHSLEVGSRLFTERPEVGEVPITEFITLTCFSQFLAAIVADRFQHSPPAGLVPLNERLLCQRSEHLPGLDPVLLVPVALANRGHEVPSNAMSIACSSVNARPSFQAASKVASSPNVARAAATC